MSNPGKGDKDRSTYRKSFKDNYDEIKGLGRIEKKAIAKKGKTIYRY